ncbi:MAG TPA: glycine--tRNA ligase subunit beta, partial [Candidatus Wallbacteria bacterium]|nr:glycine--tRNA ligase subunit beta [Candidatus Wallbacteria bacterium]
MKKDFIVEIGVEEIPAGFIEPAIDSLHTIITEKLRSSNIGYEKSYFYSTPRRLTVYVTGVDQTQKDQFEEVKGPPKKIAFSDIGRPTQAAIGF